MRRRIKGILMSGKQYSLDSRLDLFHGIETSPSNRNSTILMRNLPAVEDTTEYEDKSSSPSGEYFIKSLNTAWDSILDCRSYLWSIIFSA